MLLKLSERRRRATINVNSTKQLTRGCGSSVDDQDLASRFFAAVSDGGAVSTGPGASTGAEETDGNTV